MGFAMNGLEFKEIEHCDSEQLRAWRNDPVMSSGWHTPFSVQTMEEQLEWYASLGRDHQAYIVMNGAKKAVGLLRFRLDWVSNTAMLTGTDVFPKFQRKGYGKRILASGADYLMRDLGFHRVTAEAMDTNIAAQKIITACGFTQEGTLRQYVWRDGAWRDWYVYSKLRGEL